MPESDKKATVLTAYVNGHFLPLTEAFIHVEDRGFQFADSVYEVIACYHGIFLDLPAHLRRLEASCDAIGIALPFPVDRLEFLIRETYRCNPLRHASLYVQITRGVAPRSLSIPENLDPSLIITCRELSFPPAQAPVFSAITLPDFRWNRCDIKTTALIASVMGRQQAVMRGAEEAFWIDDEDHVLEGTATNVLAVIDGALVSHPLDRHVLGGITRNLTLHLAGAAGIPVEERPWRLSEMGISECMIASTLYALAPVCCVDGQKIGTGTPGPMTLRLREDMLRYFRSLGQE